MLLARWKLQRVQCASKIKMKTEREMLEARGINDKQVFSLSVVCDLRKSKYKVVLELSPGVRSDAGIRMMYLSVTRTSPAKSLGKQVFGGMRFLFLDS